MSTEFEDLRRQVKALLIYGKSTDAAIVSLRNRVEAFEELVFRQNNIAQAQENPKPPMPGPVTCPECGGLDIGSKDCTAILPDRGIQHRCRSCEHYWRVNIKGAYLPKREERGQVYRIAYKHDAKKPTFVHVRAVGEIEALMAFIAETSKLQVSAVCEDDEYEGPLLNERLFAWMSELKKPWMP